MNAGVVESITKVMTRVGDNPMLQMAALTITVAICSGFMNNVGALALLMLWRSGCHGKAVYHRRYS